MLVHSRHCQTYLDAVQAEEDAENRADVKARLAQRREDRHHEVTMEEREEEVEAVLLRPPRSALDVGSQHVDETLDADRDGHDAEMWPPAAGRQLKSDGRSSPEKGVLPADD